MFDQGANLGHGASVPLGNLDHLQPGAVKFHPETGEGEKSFVFGGERHGTTPPGSPW
jgi:hypothetical protein